MRYTTLLPALAALCSVQAQQIDGYRYWFDDNIAGSVTTDVGATDELALTANWPTGSMISGHHLASYQVRDTNGMWSVPRTHYFTRGNQAISGYRYWVNDDMDAITTGSVSPSMMLSLNTVIDPGGLEKDYNIITIQFRDADGEWSVPSTYAFVKNTGLVNGYEYWIDDNIADRISGSIGPNGIVDLIADLATSVPAGEHLFTIRFSGANGTWSVPLSSTFSSTVNVSELPGIDRLVLFPNPADDHIILAVEMSRPQVLRLTLVDGSGRIIGPVQNSSAVASERLTLSTASLTAGHYLLHIEGEVGRTTLPFMVR
jgi:hypothetical protein